MRRSTISLAIVMAFAVLLAACGSVKQAKKDLLYLKQGSLDTLPNLSVPIIEAKIQPNDVLSITVYSDNPEASAIYNQGGGGSVVKGSTESSMGGSGYLVDQKGFIQFQTIGPLKVAGMSRLELSDTINTKLQRFLRNPYVEVRILNTKVTILGEVQRPGVFSIPNEKISVLELIGMAGDINIYGRKDNILVIRESNGKREFGHLDLRKSDIFQSPYYYLQQNDLVIVETNGKKQTANEQDNLRKFTMVASATTIISTIAIVISIFKK